MQHLLLRAAFAALVLASPCCKSQRVVSLLPEERAALSKFVPNAFIRVGESTIYEYEPGKAGPDVAVGACTVTVDHKANTITLVTGLQITPTAFDLYQDARAITEEYTLLPSGEGRYVLRAKDKGVKVSDVVLVWVYFQ